MKLLFYYGWITSVRKLPITEHGEHRNISVTKYDQ